MVADAQRSRAPIQGLADRVAGYFVPTVIVIAVLTFLVWSLIGPEPRMAYGLVNAVAVLIIACPCALGLATPMSIMVASGKAAQSGVLFRNAEAIELLRKVNILVVDKTGTLTEGKPTLRTVLTHSGVQEETILRLAATIELASEHPLAAAIVSGARERRVQPGKATSFRSLTGKGVVGEVDHHQVALGNRLLLDDLKLDADQFAQLAERLRDDGQTVMFVAVDNIVVGLLGVADPIKDSAAQAIEQLHAEGIRIVMLTGDNQKTAMAVANHLHLDDVIAEVLPDDK
jgi:Cu+-exporting ATPase